MPSSVWTAWSLKKLSKSVCEVKSVVSKNAHGLRISVVGLCEFSVKVDRGETGGELGGDAWLSANGDVASHSSCGDSIL